METIERTVWCDHEDCERWSEAPISRLKEARQMWRSLGWQRHPDGDWWCPKHARGEDGGRSE